MRGRLPAPLVHRRPLISLASLDSFPSGGSLFSWGATIRRAYLRACRGHQAPRNNAPCRAGACALRPISPSVICFANATSLVRGRLFPLAPSDEGAVERSETGGEIAPVSLWGASGMLRPTYNRRTPPPVGRFHTFIGNRAVLRPFPATKKGPLLTQRTCFCDHRTCPDVFLPI